MSAVFTRLCEQVAADLQRKGYVGRTIGIKIKYDNFRSVTRDYTADEFTADAKTIRQWAGQCLKRVPLDRRIRLLGVRVGTLEKVNALANGIEQVQKNKSQKPAQAMNLLLFEDL